MIQTALFFFLGFLAAGFLALLVAPAIWRRAVILTRRQIEAAMPLRLDEIRAGKDLLRAEFAVEIRKLEMKIKALKDKSNEQSLEIERCREQIRHLSDERDAARRRVEQLERRGAELNVDLGSRREELTALAAQVEEQEKLLEDRSAQLTQLGRMYDEASILASTRQIELVSSEARLEKMNDDLAAARSERKEADRSVREALADSKSQAAALRAEQKKTGALERQLERIMASASETEDKLERRERELARLRDKNQSDTKSDRNLQTQLMDEQDRNVTLEERVTTLVKENRALRSELGQIRRAGDNGKPSETERRDEAQLRDQISQLAAEVVGLTATLEGPQSPIHTALAAADGKTNKTTSLAERIRTLQKASGEQS